MAPRRPPLILLPPSESKWAPARGKPIDLDRLSFPALTPLREALLDDALGRAPTTTAARLYTGVLYAALDIATLPPRAAGNIVIVSAQFGALRPADRVPAYRREMDAAHWRAGLATASARPQRGVWSWTAAPPPTSRPGGRPATAPPPVSSWRSSRSGTASGASSRTWRRRHAARWRATCSSRAPAPARPAELADAVGEVYACELTPPERAGAPYVLTVVQR